MLTVAYPIASDSEAEWPREGQPPLRIRLLSSAAYFGAGDFEDAADIAEDQPGQAYIVSYESADRPGVFDHAIANVASIGVLKRCGFRRMGTGREVHYDRFQRERGNFKASMARPEEDRV